MPAPDADEDCWDVEVVGCGAGGVKTPVRPVGLDWPGEVPAGLGELPSWEVDPGVAVAGL